MAQSKGSAAAPVAPRSADDWKRQRSRFLAQVGRELERARIEALKQASLLLQVDPAASPRTLARQAASLERAAGVLWSRARRATEAEKP